MYIIIKTYRAQGERSAIAVRARPLPGQGYPTTINVRCSKKMRIDNPIGSFFKLWVKPIEREGTPFIYSNERDPWEKLSAEQAKEFISKNFSRQ